MPPPYAGPVESVGRTTAAVAALAIASSLAGCGRSVAVQPLPIDSSTTAADCARLVGALPDSIGAGRSWRVEPDPLSTAAWGSPAVVLRCGDNVPVPRPTEQLLTVGGVTWIVQSLSDGEQYVSVERSPGVIVAVPDRYQPSAQILAEVAPTVSEQTRAVAPAAS